MLFSFLALLSKKQKIELGLLPLFQKNALGTAKKTPALLAFL
jgi:hypothetical protein